MPDFTDLPTKDKTTRKGSVLLIPVAESATVYEGGKGRTGV